MNNTALGQAQENMIAEIWPLQLRANNLLERAKLIKVTDEQSAAEAVALKREITGHRSLVNQARLGITRQIDVVKKALMGKEAKILEPLDTAQKAVSDQVIAYEQEKERARLAEIDRVDKLVDSVAMHSAYHLKTLEEVNDKGHAIKEAYAAMSPEDQQNSQVKLAFTEAINVLKDRKAYLLEQAQQAAERARLAAKAAKQAAKQRRLDAKQEKLKRQEEEDELERKAYDEKIAAERTQKNQVKTGVRTVTEISVVHANQVPREYCTPDLTLIRAAVKDGIAVPGVEVKQIKKL